MFGLDRDVAIAFDEAGEVGGGEGVILDIRSGDDPLIVGASDGDGRRVSAARRRRPVDAHPNALLLPNGTLAWRGPQPGHSSDDGVREGRLAAIIDVNVIGLAPPVVECRQRRLMRPIVRRRTLRHHRWCTFDLDTQVGGDRYLDLVDARHDVARRLLPGRVADVRLIHQVRPFATGEDVVEVPREVRIPLEQRPCLRGNLVGDSAPLASIAAVSRHGHIELIQICRAENRMQDQLVVRVPIFGGKTPPNRLRASGQRIVIGDNTLGLAIVIETVGRRVEQLGLATASEL